jgi:tRNA(adenine34) deaminase
MARAVELAIKARDRNEIPVGAVVVQDNKIVGEGFNCPISEHDPSGHAEVMALRNAGRNISNYRFPGSTLYVTLEPCIMCAGAILHARIERLVFGTRDPKYGAAGSQLNLLESHFLNHRCSITAGVMQQVCQDLLLQFFRERR